MGYATSNIDRVANEGVRFSDYYGQQPSERSLRGPIRIPSHSLLFLFNALALLDISSKSLKLQLILSSIPTPLPNTA
jgi:hypothetical protein